MKSRTSFFSWAAFRKDITRFAPAWALYTVFLMMCLVLLITNNTKGYYYCYTLAESISLMPIANICYALLCVQLLFGDLYNTRMCNALHAMPLRREGWFLTHVLAGICFSFFPNLLFSLLNCVFLEQLWSIAFFWLLAVMLQYLFFFGLAAFSAMCVGSRFAMVLIYAIVNFLSMLVYWLMDTLYLPLLYGVILVMEPFSLLCPVVELCGRYPLIVSRDGLVNTYNSYDHIVVALGDDWRYLGICAGVGLVLMVLAMLMYRKRKLERAGDFMAMPKLSPIFLVLYSLAVGTVVHLFFRIFSGASNSYLFLAIGTTVGFFTGQMLLKRTVLVFRPKTFLGFAVFAAVLAGSLGLTALDPLGVESWVPEAAEVVSVSITPNGYASYSLEDPEDIEAMLQLHRTAIQAQISDVGSSNLKFSLRYTLRSGKTAERSYTLPAGAYLQNLFSRPEYVFGTSGSDLETFRASVREIFVEGSSEGYINTADIPDLLDAIILDCQEGSMAQPWAFRWDESIAYWLNIDVEGHSTFSINVSSAAINTITWLESHGFHSEKS